MKKKVFLHIGGWAFAIGFISFSLFSSNRLSVQEKWLLVFLNFITAFLNTRSYIRHLKQFFLEENILVVKLLFQKERRYLLQNIQSWEESNYTSFGLDKDGRAIDIKLQYGKRIDLIDRYNQTEFEKLSEYLNENFQEAAKD
ncbi:hypothetical protein QNI16_22965 [Cytophagaceae bacterium YF14B1]|uniref:Uncharacterized protein n=1 Tax=Xanthocytophaga flava TaxID=3048013 RepID=A0AAE3UB39_9BACT|nr:hypothetical protein [Xanthocytophaga flavus]MDJ1483379.1 hypothetical protein [Xanthocytophaga flavus]